MLISDLLNNKLIWPASVAEQASYATESCAPDFDQKQVIRSLPFGSIAIDQADIDQSLPEQGLCLAGLHEFTIADLSLLSKYAQVPLTIISVLIANYCKLANQINTLPEKDTTKKFIVWIHPASFPAPFLLNNLLATKDLQHDFLKQSLFVDVKGREQLLKAIDSCLSSSAVGAVIAFLPQLTFSISQRFALSAKRRGIFTLFARPASAEKSAAHTRWLIKPIQDHATGSAFDLQLISKKGWQTKQHKWTIQIPKECHGCNF